MSIDYIGWFDNGTIFDTSIASIAKQNGIYENSRSYGPIYFVVGDAQVIPGLENATIGMTVGESRDITIQPADAYGDYDPSYIQPVNMSDLTEANIIPYVGETLQTMFGTVKVVSISADNKQVYIDFNHPLAGKVLHFRITLMGIN